MYFAKPTLRFALLASAASVLAVAAIAAPPAGTRIGNQAAATYTNSTGDTVTVTSNLVETEVQQVAGVDLADPISEDGSAGGKVFLPHTITNTGNGPDAFVLSALEADTGAYDFGAISIYPDADLNGVADNLTPIGVTPTLGAGETFGIVIEANLPVTATADQSETITVTATSQETGTVTDTNDDVVTISEGPITSLQKSMTVNDLDGNGTDPGDVVSITISYNSTGLDNAANLTVTDVLDPRLVYQAGSAEWSDSSGNLNDAGTLTDFETAANGSGHQIAYAYDAASTTISFLIDTVPAGRSGSVTFSAVIADGIATDGTNAAPAAADAGAIPNVATQTVEDPDVPDTPIDMPPSNSPQITVSDVLRGTLADYESSSYVSGADTAANLDETGVASSTDADGADDDVVTVSNAVSQGDSVEFEFILTNHSNSEQSFNINYANTDFPAGTGFQMLGSDGATPIAGAIGPIAPGGTTTVTLVASLPPSVGPIADGATNYTAVVTATPVGSTESNSATAEFTGEITAAAVDLVSSNPDAGDGGVDDNPTNAGDPWETQTTLPGIQASYPLEITNNGSSTDNYDIDVSGLPAGVTPTVLLNGTPITNTGPIPAGDSVTVQVVLSPEDDAAPVVDDNFTVEVSSPITGQSDSIVNAVTISEVIDISLESDQTRQAARGGVIDVPHTIRNDGNVAVTDGGISFAGLTTFNGVLYHDANGNGVADSGESIVDNIDDIGGLAVGEEKFLVMRIQVPESAQSSIPENVTITVANSLNTSGTPVTDGNAANNEVTDTISIIEGDVSLSKTQAIDPACDGNPGAFASTLASASPGQCIAYRVVAENTGVTNATNVVITDTTPAWTTFTQCAADCDAVMAGGTTSTLTVPTEGTAGQVKGAFGTLIPGGTASLTFTVQIAP